MPANQPVQLTPQDIEYILNTPPSDIQNFKSQVITKVFEDEAILEPRRIQLVPTDILVFAHGMPLPTATRYANEILDPFVSGPFQAQEYDSKEMEEYKQKSPKLVLWFTPTLAGPQSNSDNSATELTELHKNLGRPCKIFVVFTQSASEETRSPPIYSSRIKGIFWLYYNTTSGEPSDIMETKTKTDDTPNTHYIKSRNKLHRHFKYREGYDPDPPQIKMIDLKPALGGAQPAFVPTPTTDDQLRTQGSTSSIPSVAVIILPSASESYKDIATQILQPFSCQKHFYEYTTDFIQSLNTKSIPTAVIVMTDIMATSRIQLDTYRWALHPIRVAVENNETELFIVLIKRRSGANKSPESHIDGKYNIPLVYGYEPLQITLQVEGTGVIKDFHYQQSIDLIENLTHLPLVPPLVVSTDAPLVVSANALMGLLMFV